MRTESAYEPVTAEELRTHLRLDSTDQDAYLETLIETARRTLEEGFAWCLVMPQTCVDYFDEFEDEMELHWAPVQSIASITYTDTDGVSQTLADTYYELGQLHGVGYVRLQYDQSYPSTRDHEDAVAITYVSGYGSDTSGSGTSSIPKAVLHWIKMYAAWLYDPSMYPSPDKFASLLAGHNFTSVQ